MNEPAKNTDFSIPYEGMYGETVTRIVVEYGPLQARLIGDPEALRAICAATAALSKTESVPLPSVHAELIGRLADEAKWLDDPFHRKAHIETTAQIIREAIAAIRALTASLERVEEDNRRMKEYCAASAEDWARVAENLRAAGAEGFLPSPIAEMMDTAAFLRRAACGEDVWPEYQSELFKVKAALSRVEGERDEAQKHIAIADRKLLLALQYAGDAERAESRASSSPAARAACTHIQNARAELARLSPPPGSKDEP